MSNPEGVPEDACCVTPPLLREPLTEHAAVEMAKRLKALADPVRLRILHHIAASRCSSVCACHMPEVFSVTQPTLSHHLKKLVEAGLVDKEMRGKWAHFTPRPEGLAALHEYLAMLG